MRDAAAQREAESGQTRVLRGRSVDPGRLSNREVLLRVYRALQEKGYNPTRQIAHFLLTGEPAYITAHQDARSLVMHIERDEVIEDLLRFYLQNETRSEVGD